jgi:hypothetical protein
MMDNQQHLGTFSTDTTNERPFVVVEESNVSLLRMTKSVHFLFESLLLTMMEVRAILGEETDTSDTSGTLRYVLFLDFAQ